MEQLTKEQLDNKLKKFIQDPDWKYIEELFLAYMIDLVDLNNIPEGLNNDQIASEVRGRKLIASRLGQFLNETNVIREDKVSRILTPNKTSFK